MFAAARGLIPGRRVVRVGVTGLARSGKTSLLTSLAANLLAMGAGFPALPGISARLHGRSLRVAIAPSGAESLPRFDHAAHLAALAADPPHWPARTDAVSLLVLDLEIGHAGLAARLPPQRLRLEFLDYPGEWLLDLPLLGQSYAEWSAATLRRLQDWPQARDFLAFVGGLPARAPADEALARNGASLYAATLRALRDGAGLALLQPGRLLMPAPGPAPPWSMLFPMSGDGGLAGLMRARYDAYRRAVTDSLAQPSFARIDRLLVLADLLTALHTGQTAFEDARAALSAVAAALRWRQTPAFLPDWLSRLLPLGGISRVAFAATKSDHVAARQRGNLAALVRNVIGGPANAAGFAVASMRCTEDVVWTLEGHPISAVRGRVAGSERAARSYPGEVPSEPPDAAFWAHPFLALPNFEPLRLTLNGRAGVPQLGLDGLLLFLLGDLL